MAENPAFEDAASLFVIPDHYVLRMLRSQGVGYDALGVPRRDGAPVATLREAWRSFAGHYHLFTGTPSRLWIDHALNWAFGIEEPLGDANADAIFDRIADRLAEPALRPLAILDRAGVEIIATTDSALSNLAQHRTIASMGRTGRIRATYRPDEVADPDAPDFATNIAWLAGVNPRGHGPLARHNRRPPRASCRVPKDGCSRHRPRHVFSAHGRSARRRKAASARYRPCRGGHAGGG